MRSGIVAGLGALSVLLGGCTTLGKTAAQENRLVIETKSIGEGTRKPGGIYLWPPYASAAVVDFEGNRCVLTAAGAKTFQTEEEIGLKLAGLEKALGPLNLDASQKAKLVETFTKLSQVDADGAFADIALFHLCMLDQNGTFGTDETGRLKAKAELLLDAYLKTVALARSHLAKSAGN